MIRFWLCLCLWLATVAGLRAETLPALFDVVGVAANDVLNLRAGPDASAALRGELAPNAKGIEVTELSSDGRWGLVASGEASAWASMRFLQRVPGPDWDALQTPLSCYGAEPFWGLKIDLPKGSLLFSGVDMADVGLWADWTSAAAGRRGVVGMAVQGPARSGFLTLVGQACSDGMSDRMAGITVQMFLRGDEGTSTGTVGYSGCCILLP